MSLSANSEHMAKWGRASTKQKLDKPGHCRRNSLPGAISKLGEYCQPQHTAVFLLSEMMREVAEVTGWAEQAPKV